MERAERIANRRTLAPLLADVERLRPRTRGDCHPVRLKLYADVPDGDPFKEHMPCPFIGCRYHLHADVTADGVVTILSTEDMPLDIAHTCALDVIDAHPEGVTREEMAVVTRVTAERTRFYERKLERKLRDSGALEEWRDYSFDTGESALGAAMEG